MAFDDRAKKKEEYLVQVRATQLLAEQKSRQDPTMRAYYHSLAEEARHQNRWIFDKKEKIWYTPDEFIERDKTHYIEYEEVLMRCTMRDPLEALQDGNKRLMDLAARIINYERKRKQ